MLRALVAAACAAALLLTAGTAAADWNEKDVQKLVEKKKAGKGFFEAGNAAGQSFFFKFGVIGYVVDVKTQLCFAAALNANESPMSLTPVPCAAIKKGYPLFAPLITWEP